jgi:vancomycin resistance protein YoaR
VTRSSHGGYLSRYPLGLDAAVVKGPGSTQTLAFRNDTHEQIVMRTVSTPGIARVDLYAEMPLGRRVDFSKPSISHRQHAHDRHTRSISVARGGTRRVQVASDGMRVSVERTVRDPDGRVVHHDRWVSNYRPLDGLVLVGSD